MAIERANLRLHQPHPRPRPVTAGDHEAAVRAGLLRLLRAVRRAGKKPGREGLS